MNTLNPENILNRANELYAMEKLKDVTPEKVRYMAPETLPSIQSDQVKCAIRAIVEAVNGLSG